MTARRKAGERRDALEAQAAFGVRELRPGVYVAPSDREVGRWYTLHRTLDGKLICNCYRGERDLACKHQDRVEEKYPMTTDTVIEGSTGALVPIKVVPPSVALPSERELRAIDRAAQMAISGAIALPDHLNTPQKVATVMLMGWEMGLKPMTAIRHIYLVEGKPALSAEIMAGMFYAAEPDSQLFVEEIDLEHCTMRIVRPHRGIDRTWTTTWAEIERAGLQNKAMNKAYPMDRLRMHCTKRILRAYAPEIINNLEAVESTLATSIEAAMPEEDEPEEDELYNEGDAGLGEFVDSPPMSDESKAELKEVLQAAYRELGKTGFGALHRTLADRWPGVFLPKATNLHGLTEQDGAAIITAVRAITAGETTPEAPSAPSGQPEASTPAAAAPDPEAPGCDHPMDSVFSDETRGGVTICKACGEILEGPDAGAKVQLPLT